MAALTALNPILIVVFTLAAAVSDWRTRKLPNWLTVSALAAALLLHTILAGLPGLANALLGFAVGFGILLVLWLIGGSGGGDVKLMGALGAWLGVSLILRVFFLSAALIAVFAGAVLVFAFASNGFVYVRRRYMTKGKKQATNETDRIRQRQRLRIMPYAVPVAISTWLVLAEAWLRGAMPW
ncbi:MAG: prepilin peptidase [Rhodopirellula sp.]|nr:prepilin peptidase [Rhodopirellula sp.]